MTKKTKIMLSIMIGISMIACLTLSFSMLKGNASSATAGSGYSETEYITIPKEEYDNLVYHNNLYLQEIYEYQKICDTFLRGDINGDGVVDASDASMILSFYARMSVGEDLISTYKNFDNMVYIESGRVSIRWYSDDSPYISKIRERDLCEYKN